MAIENRLFPPGPDLLNELSLKFNWRILVQVILVVIGTLVIKRLSSFLIDKVVARLRRTKKIKVGKRVGRREKRELKKVVGYIFYAIAAVLILNLLGVSATFIAGGIGILAMVVGFAARDILSNVLAGIFLYIEKAYEINDVIRVGEVYGIVRLIQLRSTQIKTFEGDIVTIPNSKMASSEIINHTAGSDLMVSSVWAKIAYEEDIDKVKQLMREAAQEVEGVYIDKNHKLRYQIQEIGKRFWGLRVEMYFYLEGRQEPWVTSKLQQRINEKLVENKITFHQEAERP